MPVYKDPRKVKKVNIPGIEGGEVEVYNTLFWDDAEVVFDTQLPDMVRIKKVVVLLIKDWNLTNEQGEKLPINEENFGKKLTINDIVHIVSETDFGVDLIDLKGGEALKKKAQ